VRTSDNPLFSQASSFKPLAVMRILVGLVLLDQARTLWSYREVLLNPHGPVPWSLSDTWVDPLLPKLSHFVTLFGNAGLDPGVAIATILGIHALAASFMTIGYRTRLSTIVAWLTFVIIKNSSFPYLYGIGSMLVIALFYCVIMPVGRAWSADTLLKPPPGEVATDPSGWVLMLRLHLCIIYFAGGIAKGVGEQWWTGEALWRALSLPHLQQFDPTPILAWPRLLQAAAIATVLLQCAYPFLVWTRLRAAAILATELLHAGIALFLGLWLFSLVMIALNTAAFGEALWAALSPGARRRDTLPATGGRLRVIYDGACPFCDDYVRYQRLQGTGFDVELVDARARRDVLAEHAIDPRDLEDGMVVVLGERLYRGADAMHLLSTLTEAPGKWWVRLVALVARSPRAARLTYPLLKVGRRLALAAIGVPRFPR